MIGRSPSFEERRLAARRCCSRTKSRSVERKAWVKIVEIVGVGSSEGVGELVVEVLEDLDGVPVSRDGEKRRK